MLALDSGAVLQAVTSAVIFVLGFAIAVASRRAKSTRDTIDEVREELRRADERLRAEVSIVRSDVAEIKGYLRGALTRRWPLRDDDPPRSGGF